MGIFLIAIDMGTAQVNIAQIKQTQQDATTGWLSSDPVVKKACGPSTSSPTPSPPQEDLAPELKLKCQAKTANFSTEKKYWAVCGSRGLCKEEGYKGVFEYTELHEVRCCADEEHTNFIQKKMAERVWYMG